MAKLIEVTVLPSRGRPLVISMVLIFLLTPKYWRLDRSVRNDSSIKGWDTKPTASADRTPSRPFHLPPTVGTKARTGRSLTRSRVFVSFIRLSRWSTRKASPSPATSPTARAMIPVRPGRGENGLDAAAALWTWLKPPVCIDSRISRLSYFSLSMRP